MNRRTLDLIFFCQATARARDFYPGLPWRKGRVKLRCSFKPGHRGPHSYELGPRGWRIGGPHSYGPERRL